MTDLRSLLIDCRIELRKLSRDFQKTELCERLDLAIQAQANAKAAPAAPAAPVVNEAAPGVAPEKLGHLTTPFFRGDTARTAANGAGLGLSIVEKTIGRMGGTFTLSNTSSGGLVASIKLQRAPRA